MSHPTRRVQSILKCDDECYLFEIFAIPVSGKDEERDEEGDEDDDGQVDGFVSHEVHVGKDVAPVDRVGQDEKTARKCGQMRGEALCLVMVRRWSDL